MKTPMNPDMARNILASIIAKTLKRTEPFSCGKVELHTRDILGEVTVTDLNGNQHRFDFNITVNVVHQDAPQWLKDKVRGT